MRFTLASDDVIDQEGLTGGGRPDANDPEGEDDPEKEGVEEPEEAQQVSYRRSHFDWPSVNRLFSFAIHFAKWDYFHVVLSVNF